VVVRWSGTEPKLRVMIEGENEERITILANGIAAEAKQELS
jgi:phosphoglucosamine mutase